MRARARFGPAAAALALLVSAGCASAPGAGGGGGGGGARLAPEMVAHLPAGAPLRSSTLQPADMWLRHYVMEGDQDSVALAMEGRKSRIRFGDELQETLQLALALHQAGEYEQSNRLFEEAEREADDRYTRSISQIGLSFASNDMAMDWVPSRTEMSMIPYYRISNYLRMGDLESALVEARKASAYLAQIDDATGDPCRSSTFLRYLTGIIYEMGGEENDAVVSMRQAEQGFRTCEATYGFGPPASFGSDLYRISSRAGFDDVAAAARERYAINPAADEADGTGEVVVLIENGYVAHRAEQSIHFPIFDGEVAGLDIKDPFAVLTSSVNLTTRILNNLIERDLWGVAWDDLPEVQLEQAAAGAYIMELAWPSYRLEANGAQRVRLVAGEQASDAVLVQDVSGEVIRDFEAQRKKMIARSIGRGIVKYVGAQEIEKRVGQKNYFAGLLAGAIANAGANAMEKADTRSWSLLPDRLAMARVRLPAGEHDLRVEVVGPNGEVSTERVGTVTVQPGRAQVVTHRVWGRHSGDRGRLARAASGVTYAEITTEDGEILSTPSPTGATAPAAAQVEGPPPAAPAPVQAASAAPAPESRYTAPAAQESAPAAPTPAARAAPVQQQPAAAIPPQAPQAEHSSHALAVMPFNFIDNGFGFEYERARGSVGTGLVASSYLWDYDTRITAVGVRFRRYYASQAHRGFNTGLTMGGAYMCDGWCTATGVGHWGVTGSIDAGYSVRFGPVAFRLAAGAQAIVDLTSLEESPDAPEILYTPVGGLTVGWVIGR